MFPMAGHSFRRIWIRFGVRLPYNPRMVKRAHICRETTRRPSTVGSFRMPLFETAAAANQVVTLTHLTNESVV